ncbi:uncharacterized protein LOC124253312 [Haliotis rubra]|uniref:uncharacterized protein LOC124253312 n=1 Tax=Haliotis rubra TaxID=36100 RepID=UPI001EE5C99A|nr:uncharacterized protein LOC124253312 [Haliotis rubra]
MERRNSLMEIIESVATKGIFPSLMFKTFEAEGKYRNLTSRLRDFISKAGRAVVGRSMAAICNLKNCDARPETVICDSLLISKSIPPTLLTFVEDSEDIDGSISASNIEGTDDLDAERQYNKSIAKAMTYARYFTDEPFDVIYGVIRPEDTKTTKVFNRRLSTLKEETSAYSIGSNLLMSEERCLKIHKAFIMMSALSDHRSLVTVDENTGRASHYVMTVDMHRKLMLYTDSIFSGINESHSGETLISLLNERISKIGKRVVDRVKSETGTADDVNTNDEYVFKDLQSERDKASLVNIFVPSITGQCLCPYYHRHILFAPSSVNSYAGPSFLGLTDLLFEINKSADPAKQWERVKQHFSVILFTIQSAAATLRDLAHFL